VRRIGLFGRLSREGVSEMVRAHREKLGKSYEVEVFDCEKDLPDDPGIELAVIMGGDGTILGAARYLAPRGIPAVGVNLGRFGFLAGCVPEQCAAVVEGVKEGALKPVVRTMLSCRLPGGEELTALNDVVITSAVPTHMIGLGLSINNIEVSSIQGDGLIVATATGSTAYNLSSGGPLVTPSEDVIVLNGLAPHTLSIRPMVISGEDVVEAEVSGRDSGVAVTADGQVARELASPAKVEVRRAPFEFRLYESPDWSFYRVVRSKLRWGEEPNYAKDSD